MKSKFKYKEFDPLILKLMSKPTYMEAGVLAHEIAAKLGMNPATVGRHLMILATKGYVTYERVPVLKREIRIWKLVTK